jgi:glycosyltransferase involved in cell wall biosynthesis
LDATVVVPTFNKLAPLLRTLESLGRQDCAGSFEVVVVDDASTDGTSEALGRASPPYPLKTIVHDSNRGRAAARNSGVRAARGRLIVFLDDDMEASEALVSAHIRAHDGRDGLAAIGNVRTHPRANDSAVARYLDTRGAQKTREKRDLPFKYFSTNNSSVARRDLESVGLFDEEFAAYGFEDVEIAARLASNLGVRFVYCGEAASLHLHKHTLEELLEKKVLAGRSSLRVLLRKHPEMWPDLGLEILERPRPLRESPALTGKKMMFRILDAAGFQAVAEMIVRDSTFYHLTNRLMDFLVVRSYWIGMGRPSEREALDSPPSF